MTETIKDTIFGSCNKCVGLQKFNLILHDTIIQLNHLYNSFCRNCNRYNND